MSKPKRPKLPGVVRRPRAERRRLDPELEALARGDSERIHRPRPRPRLRDPRAVALLPGVANRDAREVAEAYVDRLRAELKASSGEGRTVVVGEQLLRVVQLGLWRGLNVTSFEAFVEQILEIPFAEARRWVGDAEKRLGVVADRLSDEAIAVWVRTEIAFLETEIQGKVSVMSTADEREVLCVEVMVDNASQVFAALGRKHAALAADQMRGAPPKKHRR